GPALFAGGSFTIAGSAASVSIARWSAASLNCRRGNVNGAVGPVADVLFVNGSAGAGLERRVVADKDAAFEITMGLPPSLAGHAARFALSGWLGWPAAGTKRTLPFGLGESCMPTPLTHDGPPNPKAIWNNAGHDALLGTPTLPSAPAPSTVFRRAAGL